MFNSLKDNFPRVKSIISQHSELGGSMETLILEEGGELQFYLTENDRDYYIPKIISYYAISQIMHLLDPLDKADYNMNLDRSCDIITVEDTNYFITDIKVTRGDTNDSIWDPVWDIIKVLKSNMNDLNYTYIVK